MTFCTRIKIELEVANCNNTVWPVRVVDPAGRGIVKLGAVWMKNGDWVYEDRVLFPKNIYPGEKMKIDLILTPVTDEKLKEPGDYEVMIRVVKECVAWLEGDEPAKINVRIK